MLIITQMKYLSRLTSKISVEVEILVCTLLLFNITPRGAPSVCPPVQRPTSNVRRPTAGQS